MKYLGIEEDYFKIKLKKPFKNSKMQYANRKGFFITLSLGGYQGRGEVAPLPGFSQESIDESLWAIEQLKNALKRGSNYEPSELLELFELFTSDTPCLNFALDIALYDILSQIKKVPISKYINKNALSQINFSSMSGKSLNKSDIIKLKFGVNDLQTDIKYFKKIQSDFPAGTCFRLDANNSYDVDDAIFLLNKLEKYNIDFIEEPLSDMSINNLKRIKKYSSINIALDESIISNNYKKLIASGLIDCVVLKASLFGSIKKIKHFNQYLKKYKVKLVLSSALHSPIGNMSNIHVASFLELDYKHGLNNFMFYKYSNTNVPYKDDSRFVDLKSIEGLGAFYGN